MHKSFRGTKRGEHNSLKPYLNRDAKLYMLTLNAETSINTVHMRETND